MTQGAKSTSGALRRTVLMLLWLGVLAVIGWAVSQRLQLSGDLRAFMPAPQTQAQKFLLDELGEGPGSRLLLIELSGADAATLAAQSRALRARLSENDAFGLVANGADTGLDAIPEHLRPYRYLLSPTLDTQALDAAYLSEQLRARVQDLGSPAAALVEPLIPADPTLETLKLAESWQPADAPQRRHGVWFDDAGDAALLIAQTVAAGFDPRAQQAALAAIESDFAAIRGASASTLIVSGPGAFSVRIGARTEAEARWIGMVDTIGLLLLLLIAYRNWRTPLLGALPLASGGLAGLIAVMALFAEVHGITIAFGFTLIGVAQDYPIHFFSHQRAGVSTRRNVRALWPTLATGVVATCIAYLTFFASGVDGLEQLATFAIAGLGTAALTTRYLLPGLLADDAHRDPAQSTRLKTLWTRIERLPRPRWSLAALAAIALTVIVFAPGATWQNDLSKLTPVPTDALAIDARLRSELGAPDVRYLIALHADDVQAALLATEHLQPALDALVAEGALNGYDMAARYLPSTSTQRRRQARLPGSEALRERLAIALAGTPLRADAFLPFIDDVAIARTVAPLRAEDLAGTPLAERINGLLLREDKGVTALVSLSGLRDVAALANAAQAHDAQLFDLKQASESLVAAYRQRVLMALALAALLLAATVWVALRSGRRTLRVLLPMALTTLLVIAILRACGVELSLFHLVALILAAGLGLDYALFFEHAGDNRDEQLRTLHAVIVCSLMTLLVFSLLALSSIPVLSAIGSTVTLGVIGNFVLGLLIARHPKSTGAGRSV